MLTTTQYRCTESQQRVISRFMTYKNDPTEPAEVGLSLFRMLTKPCKGQPSFIAIWRLFVAELDHFQLLFRFQNYQKLLMSVQDTCDAPEFDDLREVNAKKIFQNVDVRTTGSSCFANLTPGPRGAQFSILVCTYA